MALRGLAHTALASWWPPAIGSLLCRALHTTSAATAAPQASGAATAEQGLARNRVLLSTWGSLPIPLLPTMRCCRALLTWWWWARATTAWCVTTCNPAAAARPLPAPLVHQPMAFARPCWHPTRLLTELLHHSSNQLSTLLAAPCWTPPSHQVAATLLAKQGLRVEVLEQRDIVGGACRTEYPFEKAPGLPQSTGGSRWGSLPQQTGGG